MDKFWDAFNESSVMQGIISCALTGGVVYLAVVQAEIPDELGSGFLLMLGFFFGSKGVQQAQVLARKLKK